MTKRTSKSSQPFVGLPKGLFQSQEYRDLSVYAKQLLLEIRGQYRGSNNGDLQCVYRLMEPAGWNSKATLHKALKKLLATHFLEVTRPGSRGRCTLFALTHEKIDECLKDGRPRHDARATQRPSSMWRREKQRSEEEKRRKAAAAVRKNRKATTRANACPADGPMRNDKPA